MADAFSQAAVTASYRESLLRYGPTPAGCQWSTEGQRFRFAKLLEVGSLTGLDVLDMGCGVGDLYPLVLKQSPMSYTGLDIMPEMIQAARNQFPDAVFTCRDVLAHGLDGSYDVGFISGLFNNAREDPDRFMETILTIAFDACRKALAFNFISVHSNPREPELSYYGPTHVLDFCVRRLSHNIAMHHGYQRADVAVFVYR